MRRGEAVRKQSGRIFSHGILTKWELVIKLFHHKQFYLRVWCCMPTLVFNYWTLKSVGTYQRWIDVLNDKYYLKIYKKSQTTEVRFFNLNWNKIKCFIYLTYMFYRLLLRDWTGLIDPSIHMENIYKKKSHWVRQQHKNYTFW